MGENATPANVAPLAAFAGRRAKRVRSERVLCRAAGWSFYSVWRRRLYSQRGCRRFLVIQSAERNRVERNLRQVPFGICQPAGGLHLQPQPAHACLGSVLEWNAQQLSGSARQFSAERNRRCAGLFSPAAEPVETISICWYWCRAFLQLTTESGLGRWITVASPTTFFLEPSCTSCAGGNGCETGWGLDVSLFVQRDPNQEPHQ